MVLQRERCSGPFASSGRSGAIPAQSALACTQSRMEWFGSWRAAQRVVDIALRFDAQVALLLHER
jgi:hypothetical protein